MVKPIGGQPWTTGPGPGAVTWTTTNENVLPALVEEERSGVLLKIMIKNWHFKLSLEVWKADDED